MMEDRWVELVTEAFNDLAYPYAHSWLISANAGETLKTKILFGEEFLKLFRQRQVEDRKRSDAMKISRHRNLL